MVWGKDSAQYHICKQTVETYLENLAVVIESRESDGLVERMDSLVLNGSCFKDQNGSRTHQLR